MSTQSDPGKAEMAGDDWKPRSGTKRSAKRPYLIEWRYRGSIGWMRKHSGEWRKWAGYETRKRRDQALEQKLKDTGHRDARWGGFEYRAVDV